MSKVVCVWRSQSRAGGGRGQGQGDETHAVLLEFVADVQSVADSIAHVDGEVWWGRTASEVGAEEEGTRQRDDPTHNGTASRQSRQS